MHVLIVDDHPIVRFGAHQLVLQAWPDARVDEAETLADALALCAACRPDAVLLDLELPDATGVEGVNRLLRAVHEVPVLVFSQNVEEVYAPRAFELGVRGFLRKDRAGDELVTALKQVLGGRRYVSAELADRLLDLLDGGRPQRLPHEALTMQEFRVMQQICAGRTPAQIAVSMSLSVKTVGSYRARIFAKTGWRSTAELTRYCVQHGLGEPV